MVQWAAPPAVAALAVSVASIEPEIAQETAYESGKGSAPVAAGLAA